LAGGVLVLVVVIALVSAGRSLRGGARTLDELTAAAERVERGDYRVRVPVPTSGPRELREFARRFDAMIGRLGSDEERRRALLADVSHELRTPLAVVRGNVEAIVDGVHPADPDHLRAILDETELMSRLIEDLRTLALSEAGTLSLHREPTDLGALLENVVRAFGPAAATGSIELSLEVEGPIPTLDVDPVRTREVVENLVANAIRHTPAGGSVTLSAALVGADIEVAVADTGPGIDPDLLPTLFDRFTKSAGSGGSGLGLAIARQLVLAQGGTIAADIPPGGGTTIRVHLPQGEAGR
jgi:two-component system sensor histidine kinase BaeS